MADETGSLNRNQRKALVELLRRPTIAQAAKAADLGERTLYRYLADPFFKRELRARQGHITVATTSALIGAADVAVKVLVGILEDKDATNGEKIRAGQVLLSERTKAIEKDAIIERLELLEEVIYGSERWRPA